MSCPICLQEFLKKIVCRPNFCSHQFCVECLVKWSEKQSSCPLCRKQYTKIKKIDEKNCDEDLQVVIHSDSEYELTDGDMDSESDDSDDDYEIDTDEDITDEDNMDFGDLVVRTHPYNLRPRGDTNYVEIEDSDDLEDDS